MDHLKLVAIVVVVVVAATVGCRVSKLTNSKLRYWRLWRRRRLWRTKARFGSDSDSGSGTVISAINQILPLSPLPKNVFTRITNSRVSDGSDGSGRIVDSAIFRLLFKLAVEPTAGWLLANFVRCAFVAIVVVAVVVA